MTEIQTPNPDCPQCAGTGFIPPFMDACTCEAEAPVSDATLEALSAAAVAALPADWPKGTEAAEAEARIGELTTTLSGGLAVWNGTEWATVETEALTAAEYAAKYPKPHRSGDEMFDELMDQANAWDVVQQDEAAEAAALVAAAADVEAWICDKGSEHPWSQRFCTCADDDFDVVFTADVVADTMTAADEMADEIIAHYGEDAIVAAVAAVADDDGEADLGAVLEAAAANESMVAAAYAGEPPFKPRTSADTWTDLVAACDAIPVKAAHTMSEAQGSLIGRLIAERDTENVVVKAVVGTLATTSVNKAKASTLIDALLAVPANPAKKPLRQNSYEGICRYCGGPVAAMAGRIDKVEGRWQTSHLSGDCLTPEAKAAMDADKVDEPGLYKLAASDGEGTPSIYRVRPSRTTKRLYAERVCPMPDGSVSFSYNAKAIFLLRKSDRLTWAEARHFGCAYGACVACGRTLSDNRSLVQGYGATCAKRYHWPTVTAKQAEAIIEGVLTWEDAIDIAV